MPEQYGLNVIQELRKDIGANWFSDPSTAAEHLHCSLSLGASILKFHVVFDRQLWPDAKAP
jgi:N-acetylneuraminate synthase